jgi:hypothetical protein
MSTMPTQTTQQQYRFGELLIAGSGDTVVQGR